MEIGDIRCRFDEESRDAKRIGDILKNCVRGDRFMPSFLIQENYGSVNERCHEVRLMIQDIKRMCDSGVFQLPSQLKIQAVSESSITRLSLRLQNDFYYCQDDNGVGQVRMEPFLSISGFPRRLWVLNGHPSQSSHHDEGSDGNEGVHELAGAEVRSQSVSDALSEIGTSSPSSLGKMFRLPGFGRSAPPVVLASTGRTGTSSPDPSKEIMERLSRESPGLDSRPYPRLSSESASSASNIGIVGGMKDVDLDNVSEQTDYRYLG